MQRVISDGRAAHPGEVAVLLVVSCYTVRNRFQCLVGHLDQVQVLPLHFTFPVRQWQSTTFMVVTWQLVTELTLILKEAITLVFFDTHLICDFSLRIILKFWNFEMSFKELSLIVFSVFSILVWGKKLSLSFSLPGRKMKMKMKMLRM